MIQFSEMDSDDIPNLEDHELEMLRDKITSEQEQEKVLNKYSGVTSHRHHWERPVFHGDFGLRIPEVAFCPPLQSASHDQNPNYGPAISDFRYATDFSVWCSANY
jgi:hypothetical protein